MNYFKGVEKYRPHLSTWITYGVYIINHKEEIETPTECERASYHISNQKSRENLFGKYVYYLIPFIFSSQPLRIKFQRKNK